MSQSGKNKMNKRLFYLALFLICLATVRCGPSLTKTYKTDTGHDLPLEKVFILYVPKGYKLWRFQNQNYKSFSVTSKPSRPLYGTGDKAVYLEFPAGEYLISVSYYHKDVTEVKKPGSSRTTVYTHTIKSYPYSVSFRGYGNRFYKVTRKKIEDLTNKPYGKKIFDKLTRKRR